MRKIRIIDHISLGGVIQAGTPVWSHNGMICTGESYKIV